MYGIRWIIFCRGWGNSAMSHEWQEIFIHGIPHIVLFVTHYIQCPEHTNQPKQTLITPLTMLPRTVFSDLTLWHRHSWPVTSCESEVLVLCHIYVLFINCSCTCKRDQVDLCQWITRTIKMPAFWGYILDPKSKEDNVKATNLKNLPKFQIF